MDQTEDPGSQDNADRPRPRQHDECGQTAMPQPMRRETAREALTRMIDEQRDDLAGLDALYRALPLELPYKADLALWKILRAGIARQRS